MRNCPTCQTDMSAMHYRRKYCSRKCAVVATRNDARKYKRETYQQKFIGVDGEGVNLPTSEHRYVMLSCGDQTLYKNGDALNHDDCLTFLYDCFLAEKDPKAAYVGFYLGYDFTMWLKSITAHEAEMLFSPSGIAKRKRKNSPMPFPVYLGSQWEIDMLGMKRLRFRPHRHNGKADKCGCGYRIGPFSDVTELPTTNDLRWMYVCDVGSFFQTSFVNVLDPTAWKGEAPCTADEYATIVEGKSKRANHVDLESREWVEPMRQYNILENRLLSQVMEIYSQGFRTLGVKLNKTSYFGPGQAAQQWLTTQAKGKTLEREQLQDLIPAHVINAWRASYYGGRFEIFYHGTHTGTSWEYDIQSAYPHAISQLPCLCRATWHSDLDHIGWENPLALVYATVTARNEYIGPLPHRLKNGSIVYPAKTTGWYRAVELHAAFKAGLVEAIETYNTLEGFTACKHDPPLKALANLFEERIRVGKSTPHGKALKLIYNSCYGKFAQSVGEPRYGNPIYASIITSDCRIRILNAIATHPTAERDLLMIATDGIYFATQHPDMPTENVERLGEWEASTKSNLTLMKPGVYWDDAARQAIKAGKDAKLKSRGISAKALQKQLGDIDRQFRGYISGDNPLPTIRLESPFSIVSPRLALARGKWHTAGQVHYNLVRTDSAVIAPKREGIEIETATLFRSRIRDNSHLLSWDTKPYEKTFGYGDEIVDDEYYTPDGHAITLAQSDLLHLGES